jgi:single stranded DNA-binding protein
MNDINSITITGRLTKDPERTDYQDKVRLTLGVACNRSKRNQDGTWEEKASFFIVSWWRKDTSGDIPLYKGTAVCVTGQMVQYEYTAKDGTTQRAWSIEAQTVRIFAPPAQAGEKAEAHQEPFPQSRQPHQDAEPKRKVDNPVVNPYVNDNYPF